jgi:hypothetical protein
MIRKAPETPALQSNFRIGPHRISPIGPFRLTPTLEVWKPHAKALVLSDTVGEYISTQGSHRLGDREKFLQVLDSDRTPYIVLHKTSLKRGFCAFKY